MAGVIGVFASIGEHIPLFNKDKFNEPRPEGEIAKFHYRGTVILILAFCLLVTTTEWISGTESIIECLHGGAIPDEVINNYCYISGTFSVPRHYVDELSDIGNRVAASGVGPYDKDKDFIEIKAYYQWVPFMLFLQAVMFYIPHMVYKEMEGGRLKTLVFGLNQWIGDDDERNSKEKNLAQYLVGMKNNNKVWAMKCLMAQSLYLVNVIGNIFFTDCFLGWEFTTYGVAAASFLEEQPDNRVDPMSRTFPRVTKCTFEKYGPSGTIQKHDAQCILPINIINEKIYVFLWFWFCLLSALTICSLTWNIGILCSKRAWKIIMYRKVRLNPKRKELRIDYNLIIRNFDYGDWKILYHLMLNMDTLTFGQILQNLTKELSKSQSDSDNLSLETLLKGSNNKPSCPSPDAQAEEDFMREHNLGNYIKKDSPSPTYSEKETNI